MKRLLLAGAGHAHLHLLRELARAPWPGVEVTLVAPYGRQIYSGMIPGWMAGHYALAACTAPLAPLLRRSGVRWVASAVTALDAAGRSVLCADGERLGYDVLSLDTGAGIADAGWAASGARYLPIRPLERFVKEWEDWRGFLRPTAEARVAVVGGGPGGVELAFAAEHALRRRLPAGGGSVVLVSGRSVLHGHAPAAARLAVRTLAERGIRVLGGYAKGHAEGLELDDGRVVPADLVLAATGTVAPEWLRGSGLALCPRGFVACGEGQRSRSHPEVFAAGDVATRVDAPHARSGVYAVRAGPVLTRNLARALRGEVPVPYRPQRRSLYLLATGPREAILTWGPIALRGGWAWRLKDGIDRRFMARYQE